MHVSRFLHARLGAALVVLIACGPAIGSTSPNLVASSATNATLDKVTDAALEKLRQASRSGTADARKAALDALLALNDPGALGPLGEELGAIAVELRQVRASANQLKYEIGRKQELISDLERRSGIDSSLEGSLKLQRERLDELNSKHTSRQNRLADLEPWLAMLRTRSTAFAAGAPSGARKKAEKDLWKVVEQAEQDLQRIGAIEALGCIGHDSTAVEMQKIVTDFAKERSIARAKLPKLMRDVVALEKRMQEEAVRTDGRTSMDQQYQRAKAEAAALQTHVNALGMLCDAAVTAGGLAFAREAADGQARTLDTLLRAQKKAKYGSQRDSLLLIAAAHLPQADEALFQLLLESDEPLVRETMIEVLTTSSLEGASDESRERFHDRLLNQLLSDESWFVRSAAVGALAKLRSKPAIPVFIDRLEIETGRMLDDLNRALTSLTGKDFHGNVPLWKRWWSEDGETFVVPPLDEVRQAIDEKDKERRGSTFFGISTESTRVLYVLDLSGSMNFSMIPRNNPEDVQGRPYDMPREGERSRLEEALDSLNKAIAGTSTGGVFNIVFYASDVWTWSDSLAELDDENRAEALDMISRLEAVGGTNIYGALKIALEMAGANPGDRWTEPAIDTIYFLSDGRASVGLTTDPYELLRFVRDQNASAGIVIHTIGLSGAQDAYLLRSLAEQNGGIYVSR